MGGAKKMVLFVALVSLAIATTTGTIQDDEKECADQMANLAASIPYVSGTSKKPTPECCQDTKKLKETKPKCLCVLIKESNDPSMGLPINTTLALQMPSACNIDASVSNCPTLLNLPAGSPDAKIFTQAGGSASPSATTASPSSTSSATTPSSSSSPDSSSKTDSKASPSSDGAKMMVFGSRIMMIAPVAACIVFI